MKTVLSLASLLIIILSPIVAAADTVPPTIKPEIKILATARGDVPSGAMKIGEGKLQLPKDGYLDPIPSLTPEKVEVSIIGFDLPEFPDYSKMSYSQFTLLADARIVAMDKRFNRDEVLKHLDSAGYRPARLEEMLAVRAKIKDLDEDVVVYGSRLSIGDKNYGFIFQYRYRIGSDILQYNDGARPGMFEDSHSWLMINVKVAAVKK